MSNDRNKKFSLLLNKIFYERQITTFCCILTVIVIPYSSVIPSVGAYTTYYA